jgi:hypothetical protein
VAQDRRRVHRAARSVGTGDLISARVGRASSSLGMPTCSARVPAVGMGTALVASLVRSSSAPVDERSRAVSSLNGATPDPSGTGTCALA